MPMHLHAGRLLHIAKEAFLRASKVRDNERAFVANDPLISIVFSVAALEGFINEVKLLINTFLEERKADGKRRKTLRILSVVLEGLDNTKISTIEKFNACRVILRGKKYEEGLLLYQDAKLVVALRNNIIHMRSETITLKDGKIKIAQDKIVAKLESKKIMDISAGGTSSKQSWVSRVSTPAAAKWSHNAVINLVNDFIDSVKDKEFNKLLRACYLAFGDFSNHL